MNKPIPPAIPLHPSVVPALSAFQKLPNRIATGIQETPAPVERPHTPTEHCIAAIGAFAVIAAITIFLCLL